MENVVKVVGIIVIFSMLAFFSNSLVSYQIISEDNLSNMRVRDKSVRVTELSQQTDKVYTKYDVLYTLMANANNKSITFKFAGLSIKSVSDFTASADMYKAVAETPQFLAIPDDKLYKMIVEKEEVRWIE